MRILINVHKDFVLTGKDYTGAQHFTNLLLKHIENNTAHDLLGFAFLKKQKADGNFNHKTIKVKRRQMVSFYSNISTRKILSLAETKPHPHALKAVSYIKSCIKQFSPDMFVLNGFSALNYLLLKAVSGLNIPVVAIHHGVWRKESEALAEYIPKSELKLRLTAEKEIIDLAKKNIFMSRLSYKVFADSIGKIKKNHLETIPLPYNPAFANKKLPAPVSKLQKNIGLVARWDRIKNHEFYLELAKYAKKNKSGWNFYAATKIIPSSYYASIADEYGQYIKIVPPMRAEKLKAFYQKMNMIIIPSFFETYCGVATETVLQNRPVLLSKNVGWAENAAKYNLSNWLVEFKNPKKILNKINELDGQTPPKGLIRELTQKNRPFEIFQKYLKIFESAIK